MFCIVKLPFDFVIVKPVYPKAAPIPVPTPGVVGTTITLKLEVFAIPDTLMGLLVEPELTDTEPKAAILPVREVVSYSFVTPSALNTSIP